MACVLAAVRRGTCSGDDRRGDCGASVREGRRFGVVRGGVVSGQREELQPRRGGTSSGQMGSGGSGIEVGGRGQMEGWR